MSFAIYLDDASLSHNPTPGHPERPARFETAVRRLSEPDLKNLPRRTASLARPEQIKLAHAENYVDFILGAERDDAIIMLDGDTSIGPGSTQAILKAVGAGTDAVDDILSDNITRAFVLARPPGHHAEVSRAMGFCFFNSIAIAAQHARKIYNLKRVAILDFDVHHGNGTQSIFCDEPDVIFASTHQMPLFPGTGAVSERGVGNIWNRPLAPGDTGNDLRTAWEKHLFPAIDEFEPELILVSAGFDAHIRDPLGNIEAEASDFGWITDRIVELANAHASGRIIGFLEGGYDLQGLSESLAAHLTSLTKGL
ncbi:MAG: histone deacetylase family protein [Rhodospirillales bacterium]